MKIVGALVAFAAAVVVTSAYADVKEQERRSNRTRWTDTARWETS